jgi:bifunctional N-acetylglucosamine-1-phosphate-uridyltransferase/glucosamine-1-phosphate-acetyltransferase GlmU-like protein
MISTNNAENELCLTDIVSIGLSLRQKFGYVAALRSIAVKGVNRALRILKKYQR